MSIFGNNSFFTRFGSNTYYNDKKGSGSISHFGDTSYDTNGGSATNFGDNTYFNGGNITRFGDNYYCNGKSYTKMGDSLYGNGHSWTGFGSMSDQDIRDIIRRDNQ